MNTFASDNYSTVHPRVLSYLTTINVNHLSSYGHDSVTFEAQELFKTHFGTTNVLFVSTGTAANILSLRLLVTRPYEAVITTNVSHIYEEETGALAAHTGTHIFPVAHTNGKLSLKTLKQEVELRKSLGFHSPLPKVVTIASTTEYGTYYTIEEVAELARYCHKNDMYLHMDGCRLANTIAVLGCSLKEYTKDAGVDVLSFGGAKNGLMNAEAVVIFNAPQSEAFRLQKQALQLTSKMRYVSGQFIPYLTNNLYLKNAEHANTLAQRLGKGLEKKLGSQVTFTRPIATNQLFCTLPKKARDKLREAGHEFYDWNSPNEVRFVTSWDNTPADVSAFLNAL